MIYHDSTRVFGTVSYYLWKLLSLNRPSYTVQTDVTRAAAKPTPITGAVGVGTWNTSAEFKDIKVVARPAGGSVKTEGLGDGAPQPSVTLFETDFSKGATGWKPDGGRWTVEDGAYRQNGRTVGLSYVGDESWSDYTLTLKARKLGGVEGFLVVFGRQGQSKYWWNPGGWGNREHAIEFNQSPVGRHVPGQIETGRWYDIKVELAGNQIRCYLDGQLTHEATAPQTEHFYATAGRDEAGGDIVLKAINTGSEPVTATLHLLGADALEPGGTVTILTSDQLSDNNSLDEPTRVIPVVRSVPVRASVETQNLASPHGVTTSAEFPARSFSLWRLKTR